MACERRPLSTTPVGASSTKLDGGSGRTDNRQRASSAVGSVLAERFELTAVLGVGAFGEVYRAHDRKNPETPLAIKRLRHSDAQAQYRFKREFRALCEVRHPNLVRLYELFLDENGAFFTMELVAGVDFLSYTRPTGLLAVERLRPALKGLCDGVAALHAGGRLHRDLKPSNVLVAEDGRVVIVDFGLATLFQGGDGLGTELGFTGTASYAAPEQLALGKVGPEADWYAVGTMLYEALSGSLPYEGGFTALTEAKCQAPAPLSSQPDGLDDLRELCLELTWPDPLQRGGEGALRARLGAQGSVASAARELPFLGRSNELATLSSMFTAVERGGAAIALVIAPSGLGKTALVDRFVDELRANHRAIVLRSRCYVNEELAYQAIDGCIDALSHYLCSLPRAQTAAILPRDTQSLARLFPVLDRVESIAAAPPVRSAQEDRASLRERAAAALRELTARLSDRTPLVLVVDDVHWDDEDSAWLLSSLFAEADPPALFLIATCRSELRADSHLLRALANSQAASRLAQELSLSTLSPTETLELAVNTSAEAAKDPAIAARIATESGGHPLFALELARWSRTVDFRNEQHEVSLDAAIRARARESSASAQRLLEIVCVAGHPLRYGAASAAAGSDLEAMRELVAMRLISASVSASTDLLHVYHDRVREALLSALPEERVRALHVLLAEALEREANPRYDLIVEHFLEAEQPSRAAKYALRAADRAASVLAFHRLPDLLTLALTDDAHSERASIFIRLAESYALVGRTADAAHAYRDAAELETDPDQRWELNCMAMWEALLAQDVELGFALMEELDARSALAAHSTLLRLVFGTYRYWVWRIWGPPKLLAKPSSEPHELERRRLLISFRAATALIGEHADKAAYFGAVALELAAKLGDKAIYAIFLSMLGASEGLVRGRSTARSELLLKQAKALSDELDDRGAQLMVLACEAGYATALGDYQRSRQVMHPIMEASFPNTPFGSFMRIFSQKIYLAALFWSGSLIQTRTLAARAIATARQLSDPHVEFGLRVLSAFRLLAHDDAEGAWEEWAAARERYPGHWAFRESIWGWVPALYAGRTDRAEQAIAQARRLWLLWDAYSVPGRTFHIWSWGAVAAARLAAGELSRRLKLRLWFAAKLTGRSGTYPAQALARALEAARAFLAGKRELGMDELQCARDLFATGGLHLYAASASYVLARLHASEPVRAQHRAYALEIFEREKVKRPERWVRALLPGIPEALYTDDDALTGSA